MNPPDAQNVLVRCYETTLTGGFNTSVTDFNFLEMTNTLGEFKTDDGVITGTITLWNSITNQEILEKSFSLAPGERKDENIHEAVGPGAFGTVQICHNAPQGALKGVVSQYNITNLSPLDFEPVLQQPLTTIGQP